MLQKQKVCNDATGTEEPGSMEEWFGQFHQPLADQVGSGPLRQESGISVSSAVQSESNIRSSWISRSNKYCLQLKRQVGTAKDVGDDHSAAAGRLKRAQV